MLYAGVVCHKRIAQKNVYGDTVLDISFSFVDAYASGRFRSGCVFSFQNIVDKQGDGVVSGSQFMAYMCHLVLHGLEDEGTVCHGSRAFSLCRLRRAYKVLFAFYDGFLSLGLDLGHIDHGRYARDGDGAGFGTAESGEQLAFSSCRLDLREHGQGGANQRDTSHQLVVPSVGKHPVDFNRTDIERIDGIGLSSGRKSSFYRTEVIAVFFALTF